MTKTVHKPLPGDAGVECRGCWSYVRPEVKSLKFIHNLKFRKNKKLWKFTAKNNIPQYICRQPQKIKEILFKNNWCEVILSRLIMTSLHHMASFNRPSCQNVGCFILSALIRNRYWGRKRFPVGLNLYGKKDCKKFSQYRMFGGCVWPNSKL